MIIRLKDGRVLGGSLWEWKPLEGWFTVTDDGFINHGDPIRVELSNVAAASHVERTHVPMTRGALGCCEKCGKHVGFCDGTSRVDMLERAYKDGWDG